MPAYLRVRTVHIEDPKQIIWDAVGRDIEKVHPFNEQVLVAIYIRPATHTEGGVEVAEEAVNEDRYQGKVGMVLKKGPRAFKDDEKVKFHEQDVEPGDWVVYRSSDGLKCVIGERECRLIPDVYIKARIDHPDAVF